MASFQKFGNDLYTGERSFDIVGKRRIWFAIAAALIILSVLVPVIRGGFNLGIEFTGGSEFQLQPVSTTEQEPATDAVKKYTSVPARVQTLGDGSIRVQTDSLSADQNEQLRADLASAYGTSADAVTVSTIGPSWGADITRQMVIGLAVFLVLASIFMAFYFRTWKMSLAAVLALFHDLIVTIGIFALTGVEVTPAAVIGLLTILGYSLYDTVVVFDKVRENTIGHTADPGRPFADAVNLAINQTLVRSINTSVVALLPVSAILFIGSVLMGAGTLRDISLALFIGMIIGAASTIFLAGPLYVALAGKSAKVERRERDTDAETERARTGDGAVV